jgi:hypothetical protein
MGSPIIANPGSGYRHTLLTLTSIRAARNGQTITTRAFKKAQRAADRQMSAIAVPVQKAALSSQSKTEPRALTKRRSIEVISRTISQMNAIIIRARQRCPFPTRSNIGPRRGHADSAP